MSHQASAGPWPWLPPWPQPLLSCLGIFLSSHRILSAPLSISQHHYVLVHKNSLWGNETKAQFGIVFDIVQFILLGRKEILSVELSISGRSCQRLLSWRSGLPPGTKAFLLRLRHCSGAQANYLQISHHLTRVIILKFVIPRLAALLQNLGRNPPSEKECAASLV